MKSNLRKFCLVMLFAIMGVASSMAQIFTFFGETNQSEYRDKIVFVLVNNETSIVKIGYTTDGEDITMIGTYHFSTYFSNQKGALFAERGNRGRLRSLTDIPSLADDLSNHTYGAFVLMSDDQIYIYIKGKTIKLTPLHNHKEQLGELYDYIRTH